jgi:hypothetical protein
VVGGEQHRQMTVDALLLSHFTHREKLSHTLPSKLQPVLSHACALREGICQPAPSQSKDHCKVTQTIFSVGIFCTHFLPPPPPRPKGVAS